MRMKTNDELMQTVEQGRDASIVKAMVRDVIDHQMLMANQSLINQYRQGNIDHDLMIGKIGEMAGLQNLLAELDSRERKGTNALDKVVTNAA